MIKFNKTYFIIAIVFFIIEVLIAKYSTGFIRHTIGDYLVVILLYTFIKSLINYSVHKTAVTVLIIAFVIEFLQLTNFKNLYPNEYRKAFQLVLGTSFSIGDLVAYSLGILSIIILENKINKHGKITKSI